MSFLEKILREKSEILKNLKRAVPLNGIEFKVKNSPPPLDFKKALKAKKGRAKIIAEFKRASPSGGSLGDDLNLEEVVKKYGENGASAISVLTEENYFHGSLKDLERARRLTTLPILRKDFIIDEYEIFQSRASGADSLLLIVKIFDSVKKLREFISISRELQMEPLVEVFDEDDLEMAVGAGAEIIGVNSRNLRTLNVSIEKATELVSRIPHEKIRVFESGISRREEIERLMEKGVECFLIGTSLLKSGDPGKKLRELLG